MKVKIETFDGWIALVGHTLRRQIAEKGWRWAENEWLIGRMERELVGSAYRAMPCLWTKAEASALADEVVATHARQHRLWEAGRAEDTDAIRGVLREMNQYECEATLEMFRKSA